MQQPKIEEKKVEQPKMGSIADKIKNMQSKELPKKKEEIKKEVKKEIKKEEVKKQK